MPIQPNTIEKRPCLVNFSGGKDSTYLLLEMVRRGMPIDCVVYVDTGLDFPDMYEHIDKVDHFLKAERGIAITRLKANRTFEELMFEAVRAKAPDGIRGYGWPNALVRWCTGQLKTQVIQAYTKDFVCKPYHYIAFAADETERLKRKSTQDPLFRYPLIDWGVTEAEALAGCYRAGYTWNGLYEKFHRVSCFCCPLQSLEELRTLQKDYPELWRKLREMDDRAIAQFGWKGSCGHFRPKESVRMLEVRFAFEKDWLRTGGNIRGRAFYRELERLYCQRFDFYRENAKEKRTECER